MLVLVERGGVALCRGARDDEGGPGIVDEHRVDLVNDGVVVLPLD